MNCKGEYLISKEEAFTLACQAIAKPTTGLREDPKGDFLVSAIRTDGHGRKRQFIYTLQHRENESITYKLHTTEIIDPNKYYAIVIR